MLDPEVIAGLEAHLQETYTKQNRLLSRLRDLEGEAQVIREELSHLETISEQVNSTIESLRPLAGSTPRVAVSRPTADVTDRGTFGELKTFTPSTSTSSAPVAFIKQGVNRGLTMRPGTVEPMNRRFADRTITQACTLLLKESGGALHVSELYRLLLSGGMEFKGNNPTISVAVSLSRNRRFRKVGPGTFDLIMREAIQTDLLRETSQSQAAS